MPSERVTLRIDEGDMRIFKHEANKSGVSLSEYLKGLIREGYFYRGVKDVSEEIQTICGGKSEEKKAHFEALFEIRNYLRLMSLKENQEHVATAKSKAVETAVQLLKGE